MWLRALEDRIAPAAFWEHVVGGRSPADVAAEFSVSAAAVRQVKSRVFRRLEEELGDLVE